MVQMGVKTTTIAEVDVLLKQETDLLNNDRPVTGKPSRGDAKPSPLLPASGQEIIWTNVVIITLLHVLAVKCCFTYIITLQLKTFVWSKYTPELAQGHGLG